MWYIIWRNQATQEASYMKGEPESYYWEPGLDNDCLGFISRASAEKFGATRISVPFELEHVPL